MDESGEKLGRGKKMPSYIKRVIEGGLSGKPKETPRTIPQKLVDTDDRNNSFNFEFTSSEGQEVGRRAIEQEGLLASDNAGDINVHGRVPSDLEEK